MNNTTHVFCLSAIIAHNSKNHNMIDIRISKKSINHSQFKCADYDIEEQMIHMHILDQGLFNVDFSWSLLK